MMASIWTNRDSCDGNRRSQEWKKSSLYPYQYPPKLLQWLII